MCDNDGVRGAVAAVRVGLVPLWEVAEFREQVTGEVLIGQRPAIRPFGNQEFAVPFPRRKAFKFLFRDHENKVLSHGAATKSRKTRNLEASS